MTVQEALYHSPKCATSLCLHKFRGIRNLSGVKITNPQLFGSIARKCQNVGIVGSFLTLFFPLLGLFPGQNGKEPPLTRLSFKLWYRNFEATSNPTGLEQIFASATTVAIFIAISNICLDCKIPNK